MGRTFVEATIAGPRSQREYRFLVDTGSTYMGLPAEEIEALGLEPIPSGRIEVLTAQGLVEYDSYWALGTIEGRGFGTTVLPSPVPLIGYEILENLRYRVNPVTRELEQLQAGEPGPPYQL